ncbi:AfsR/SARP family transcriptional regulator [Streptomyces sp. XH2]|uniref:AfsR/SARP family transcriptional regulator n=1 Tax=Streptomyces sp. XH2 TaxID=3412483 RepID=UPI003C7BBA45
MPLHANRIPLTFGILGTLEVTHGARPCAPTAPKPRMLLASLLIRHGHVVPTDDLIRTIWGDRPPRTVDRALQVYVSQLRRLIPHAAILDTLRPGYMLRLGPDARLDSADFEKHCRQAHEAFADGQLDQASALLTQALTLWRAPALADVRTSPLLESAAWQLDEARMLAVEQRITIDLQRGEHAHVCVELAALAAEHPLRESFQRHLMLALYRSGRPAEALRCYTRFRARLREELGLEPSPSLQQLHLAILRREPALEPPRPHPFELTPLHPHRDSR